MNEETVYFAEIIQKFGKTGPGGAITHCQLKLQNTGRMLNRAVVGPVRVGDIVTLLDCDREHRRSRH